MDTPNRLRQLIDMAKKNPPLRTAVVYPCDTVSIEGADQAAKEGLISPLLVGPEDKIKAAAQKAGIDISAYQIVAIEGDHASAVKAAQLAKEGTVQALMKGSLHSDELLGAVVDKANGLRGSSRMSHVFVMDVPTYKFPLLISDAALNIAPDLKTKKSICQNAIFLAHDLGVAEPKVAILAATETVNPDMPATLEAASLSKMADRGQITGGIVDGPLAFDNAVSMESVKIKKIVSPVAGQADVLIVPDIEAGNMVAKELSCLANSGTSGIILGAKIPVMLTSRADSPDARLASAALAVLSVAGQQKRGA